jgi:16S rRNA (guanine(966)-N(2))-methyltransferase RsmD
MRVIAGTCRGKKLAAPPGVVTRPTSDRVKEALFSILTSRINFCGIRVLDICAGTGSLGIESISRGAGFCRFIECNRSVLPILVRNLVDTDCKDRSDVLNMDAVSALRLSAGRDENFDLVFFDPPYASDLYQTVPAALESAAGLLAPAAIVVIECAVRHQLPQAYGVLKCFDRREYGESAIALFIAGEA